MSWSRQTILEDMGLARQNRRPYGKSTLLIDKGEIDPRSFGGIALVSQSSFDQTGALQKLDLRYWAVYPDGRFEKQHLFEARLRDAGDGGLVLSSLTVLGRDIPVRDSKSVDNVLEAIRRIHVGLRDGEAALPDIARIFRDCRLEDIVGEALPLPGFHEKSRIYFPVSAGFNRAAAGHGRTELLLPAEAVRPLLGLRRNMIDRDRSYEAAHGVRTRGVLPEVGRKFEMISGMNRRDNVHELRVTQSESNVPGGADPGRVMIRARWTVQGETARLETLDLLQRNLLLCGFREAMGGVGIVNRTHADMLKSGDYPRMKDHLALYGHLDAAGSSSPPPPAGGRLVLTSAGGNNLREIHPGIGEDIGGNCKIAETQWLNPATGATEKLGVILDLGAYIIRKPSRWTGGGPDLVDKLPYCRDAFISHHHLDHLDFAVPYIKRGLMGPGHTLHMTPEVWEMAKDKLAKWGIGTDDPRMPRINLLKGTGVIDLTDSAGIIRMSVAYGVDAVPHSAKDTPFIAYGRNGSAILGSYMYLGDMRFDEDWFADHDSPFWDPVRLMLDHDPTLDPERLVPTYTELDATSAKRTGRGAPERQVEDNLVRIVGEWLHDRQVGLSMIGTNDGRRETVLRVGGRTNRKMTAFGAAVEKIFAIANKHGVNPYRLARPEAGRYTGLRDYFRWHAAQAGIAEAEFAGRTSQKVAGWFRANRPGTILAFLSGSQGTAAEIDSMTSRLAEGLSHFDASPATSKTARPVNLKDWAIVVSQSAIPGNGAAQKKMIRKLAARGAVVFEAFDENLRIHNADKVLAQRIRDSLAAQGIVPEVEADGALVVGNFPIHASGHGRNGDFRLWLHKLQARFYGLHHTDDRESVMVGYDTIEEEGKPHPGGIFENGVEVEIGRNSVRRIGRTHSSVILTNEIAEEGKHYNKRLEAARIINFDDRSPHSDLGLRGSTGGAFETHFGVEDIDDTRTALRGRKRPVRSAHCRTKPRRPFARLTLPSPAWKTPPRPEAFGA